ncbi:MAG: tetratricopeptide repeat protein [Bacteroidales bacterium]|nr:tetratricopeptide repeat protein [Bacteroidales bacterium]
MKKLLIVLSFLSSFALGFAQQSQFTNAESSDALFVQGKELYLAHNFEGCITLLQKFKSLNQQSKQQEETDYMLAVSAFETEDLDSKKILQEFIVQYPYSLKKNRVEFLIGSIHFFSNDFKNCIQSFKSLDVKALSSSELVDYDYRLAYSYLTVDSAKEAQLIFRELMHKGGKYGDAATYYTAWYDYQAKDFDKATSGFESIAKNAEFSENARFYLTQIHFIKKQYPETIQLGEAIYTNHRNLLHKAELARIIGESYSNQGDVSKAIEYLTEYANQDKTPLAGSMYKLGSAWFAKQDYPKTIEYLKFATTNNDELAQSAYYYLGCSYLKIGDKIDARLAFEIASTLNFNKKTKELALYNYAMLIHETEYTGFNESVTIFEEFLNTFPESNFSDKVSGYLAEVYMNSKNFETALASIEKIKHPTNKILSAKQRILFQIGAQELINGNSDRAKKSLTRAIEMGNQENESYAESHYWRGEIAFQEEQYADAASDFQTYLNKTQANNKENQLLALYNLGYTQFKTQQLSKAQNSFEKALALGCKKNPILTADILNRLGDCRYYLKDYAVAENYYARAAQTSEVSADYSLFQQARILSLQKQFNSQIKLLDKIILDFPKSDFQDDAIFEKAQTYQRIDRKDDAIQSYSDLISQFPKSSLARDAAIQLGMLFLSLENIDKSIEWYKFAITSSPTSDEAIVANEDLKRIYKDQNRIGEYAQFLKTLDGKINFSASEQDSLMYLGAEKNYMKGNKATAERGFMDYLKEFSNGAFSLNAKYYMAMLNIDQKKETEALSYLQNILSLPENKFTETALSYSANIAYNKNEFDKAYDFYKTIEQKSETNKKRIEVREKMMLCAWATSKFNETERIANQLIEDVKSDVDIKMEARYYRAKSTIAQQKIDNLVNDLTILATDTRNTNGAEAKYLLAEYYFNADNSKKAETEIFDYINKGTPHQHWLARSFILLTDIYIKNNDLFQAKQYLLSLKNNYKEKDVEIEQMIEERMIKVQ